MHWRFMRLFNWESLDFGLGLDFLKFTQQGYLPPTYHQPIFDKQSNVNAKKHIKYNSEDLLVVTHLTTSSPACGLCGQ